MAAIKKRSLVDQVYEMLRGDIITLRRPLGSKLNVNELQDELGVSCTPIREAVNRLQQEGLVVYENNVGAHILDLDQHDITEIGHDPPLCCHPPGHGAWRPGRNRDRAGKVPGGVPAGEECTERGYGG